MEGKEVDDVIDDYDFGYSVGGEDAEARRAQFKKEAEATKRLLQARIAVDDVNVGKDVGEVMDLFAEKSEEQIEEEKRRDAAEAQADREEAERVEKNRDEKERALEEKEKERIEKEEEAKRREQLSVEERKTEDREIEKKIEEDSKDLMKLATGGEGAKRAIKRRRARCHERTGDRAKRVEAKRSENNKRSSLRSSYGSGQPLQ